MIENKGFTERCIREIEDGAVRRDPLFAQALVDHLIAFRRIGECEAFLMIRGLDDRWFISIGLLPDADLLRSLPPIRGEERVLAPQTRAAA